jgi:hypothetical protein
MLFTTVFQACSHPETQLHVAMCGCVSRMEDERKRKMTNGEGFLLSHGCREPLVRHAIEPMCSENAGFPDHLPRLGLKHQTIAAGTSATSCAIPAGGFSREVQCVSGCGADF